MVPLSEAPVIRVDNLSLKNVLSEIENGKLGFVLVLDQNDHFKGLISNADVRKGLLRNIDSIPEMPVNES